MMVTGQVFDHVRTLGNEKSSGLNLHGNVGLNRHASPAYTVAGFAGLARLYGPLSPDSLAPGDKGHECKISGPRFRPQDVFGRTLLPSSFPPHLFPQHLTTTFTPQTSPP